MCNVEGFTDTFCTEIVGPAGRFEAALDAGVEFSSDFMIISRVGAYVERRGHLRGAGADARCRDLTLPRPPWLLSAATAFNLALVGI